MVCEPLWAIDARQAGVERCPPPPRSRASAEGRRGPEWRRVAAAGRASPRPGESPTGGSTGRPARTRSYRATARSACAGTKPPAAAHEGGGPGPDPPPRPPHRAPGLACAWAAYRRIRCRVPGAGEREERHPPPAPLEDHGLLRHVSPESRAHEPDAGAGELPH